VISRERCAIGVFPRGPSETSTTRRKPPTLRVCVAAAAGPNIVADELEVAELVAHVLDALGDDLDDLGVVTEPCPLVRANPGAVRARSGSTVLSMTGRSGSASTTTTVRGSIPRADG
jgi:hypothetical protein